MLSSMGKVMMAPVASTIKIFMRNQSNSSQLVRTFHPALEYIHKLRNEASLYLPDPLLLVSLCLSLFDS